MRHSQKNPTLASDVRRGVTMALAFCLTAVGFSYAYAAFSSLTAVNTGDTLSKTAWNTMVSNLDDLNARSVPTGAVMAFYGTSCPTGWSAADGTANGVKKTDGSAGTLDLRGEFVRGLDWTRGVDSGRALASWQAPTISSASIGPDAVQNLVIEWISGNTASNAEIQSGLQVDAISDSWYWSSLKWSHFNMASYAYAWNSSALTTDNNANRPINGNNYFRAGWTRPRNVALLYCVKN